MKQKLYFLLGETPATGRWGDYTSRLDVVCRLVNSRYQKHLHTDITPLSDHKEIRAILFNISRVYEILDTILKGIYPQKMHLVLVHDYLENKDGINTLQGLAKDKAGPMMAQLKRKDLHFEMSVDREETDLAISGLVNSIQLLKQGLSPKKRRIISEYVKTSNQTQAARNLLMTQQGVSKALKSSNWQEIRDGEKKLKRALELYSARLGRKQSSLDDFY